jgi:hypothetical protein
VPQRLNWTSTRRDVTGYGQLVAWSVLAALAIGLRLLDTRSGRRFLRARTERLADWWAARQRPASEVDQEYDELSAILRRQKLGVAVERLRRIVATDESMSATRQIANRLAYRRLLYDLERTPEILPGMTDDLTAAGWPPSMMTIRHSNDPHRRAPTAEILEIGWRR